MPSLYLQDLLEMTAKFYVTVFVLLVLILLQVTFMVWSIVNSRWFVSKRLDTAASSRFKTGLNSSFHDTYTVFRIQERFDGSVENFRSSLLAEIREKDMKSNTNSSIDVSRCEQSYKKAFIDSESYFIIDRSDACSENPLVVIIVASSINNWNLRGAIRQTWGGERFAKILFLIGRSKNERTEDCAFAEEDKYSDIIMANFVDSYGNLSLKSVAMLRWVITHCPSIQFLVKADDDTFLNTPLLIRDLEKTAHRRFIMGNVIALAKPVREPTSKWFTPNSAFNRTVYPTYVSGMAYVISSDAIKDLYGASLRTPVFWLEDVYVTGLLASAVNIQHIFNGKFDGFKNLIDKCALRSHIVRHRIAEDEMQTLWTIVNDPHDDYCLRRIYRN